MCSAYVFNPSTLEQADLCGVEASLGYILIFYFQIIYVFTVHMCAHATVHVRDSEENLWVEFSLPTVWVLGSELGSSGSAALTLSPISPKSATFPHVGFLH